VPLTQASYREIPRPHYPDSARREGKEGRVLLRVLIDEEGRTKAVEVNASSGHDMLDHAATEAIKKWRFVPARSGGKPVETWIKVPIDFQLSNAKP
jgi:protein TonB